MRRSRQEITDHRIIEEILSGSELCRLGFVDGDKAYVLPFNYGYKDNCIYIHCAKEGKKLELIRRNNQVCIEIDQSFNIEKHEKACRWSMRYRSLIGYGKVVIITDGLRKKQGLDIIMRHNGAGEETDLNYESREIDSIVILEIRIAEITGKQSGNWNEN
jgi:uncharacterized protein